MRNSKQIDLRQELLSGVERFNDMQVIVVGDVMLDHYIIGDVSRISPEAPVPVVNANAEYMILGGAANVAKNIKTLGGSPILISVSGDDDNSIFLEKLLKKENINSSIIYTKNRPTTIKSRIIANNQQVVRVDKELSSEINNDTSLSMLSAIKSYLADDAIIILSDYGKGVINSFFLSYLNKMLDEFENRPKILLDPKISNADLYSDVFVITPNLKEAREISGYHALKTRMDILKAGMRIFKKIRSKHVLLTLGADGMALFLAPSKVYHIPTASRKVFDVTGAGDTVISTLGLALAAGMDLISAAFIANFAAGIVVGEVGTATTTKPELIKAISAAPLMEISTWLNEDI